MGGRLENKVAIITGASSGIGLESSYQFALEGCSVVCADITEDIGKKMVKDIVILTHNPNVLFYHCDVSKESQIAALVDFTISSFGKLDIMFNNAGIMDPMDGDLLEVTEKVWDRTMDINLKGVLYGCRHAVRVMKEDLRQNQGSEYVPSKSIINTASFVAVMGAATPQIAYTASKAAVLALTRELAMVYAHDHIRFNSLCPGPLRTPLLMDYLNTEEKLKRRLDHIPMGRFGEATEMAKAALFLASNDSSFITGSDFLVDGGITKAYITASGQTTSLPPPQEESFLYKRTLL